LGIPYEDQRISFETWVAMKGDTPFGALPSYREGDLEIFQTHAIIRHLARAHDLYGATEVDRVRCDMIEEALSDLNELAGKAPWRPDFASGRGDFVAKELAPVLQQLDRFLPSNEKPGGFWVGSSLTFIDPIAYAILSTTCAMFPEAFEECPVLLQFLEEAASRPRIAAYLASGRRPALIQVGAGGPIYDSNF
jgi:glutathione S-transferase